MKEQTCFVIGEGADAKMFLTKEEAQTHELCMIMTGIIKGPTGSESPPTPLDICRRMMLQKDAVMLSLSGKRKRKPRTPKPASDPAPAAEVKPKKSKANQAALAV